MSRLTQEKIGRSVKQSIVGHCTFKCMHEIITHVDLAGHLMTLWQPAIVKTHAEPFLPNQIQSSRISQTQRGRKKPPIDVGQFMT